MQLNRKAVPLLVTAALVFACGIGHLFVLRYRAGDIYPVYSSLRADPLGTKAFYESLARCRQVRVARNYEDVTGLNLGPETAFLWLGDTIRRGERIDGHTVGMLNAFVRRGGRLVFVFLPTNRKKIEKPKKTEESKNKEKKDETTGKNAKKSRKNGKKETARADKAPPPT